MRNPQTPILIIKAPTFLVPSDKLSRTWATQDATGQGQAPDPKPYLNPEEPTFLRTYIAWLAGTRRRCADATLVRFRA